MYTIIDYLNFRGDLDFEKSPVNEIDRMMFACIGKPDYTGVLANDGSAISLKDAYAGFLKTGDNQTRPGLLESPLISEVMSLAAASTRFGCLMISNYVRKVIDEKTEQFCALTVEGPDGIDYVTFRGTDDTLIGWKENCELAFADSVAAQIDAVTYLEKIASQSNRKIIVSGHSKGGNLAVYAASHVGPEIQEKIEAIYSYDGPGFMEAFLEKPGYQRVKDKIVTYVPKASVVGMMMNHAGKLVTVDCLKDGIMAHDTFIWGLTSRGFLAAKQTAKSRTFKTSFNELINGMPIDQRIDFTNEVFEVLGSNGATTLNDLSDQSMKQILTMADNFKDAKEIRRFIMSLTGLSIKEAITFNYEKTSRKLKRVREKI